ncbi:demethylmenaquinone methyltransferase-like isoform X4 [Homarus americanus]|uniref:demethylmenaquinone methyltransferase-like isoform X4 n=1 Tax=Homarus americanus TaxID=6706 RepID=UPI001C469FB2|nr:demethylmenaquinone methyltransferase-like isoform X4 [Homarus americanus]
MDTYKTLLLGGGTRTLLQDGCTRTLSGADPGILVFDMKNEEDESLQVWTKQVFASGQKPTQVTAMYDNWSKTYEENLGEGKYRAHIIAVDEVVRLVPEEQRRQVRVLDVGAGTGWVGTELLKLGFKNLDALEPSEGMMNQLKSTGIYTLKYQEFLGLGQNTIPSDTYDVVVVSGAMCEGHVPVRGIDDMVRVTKPGGLVVISMRLEFLETVEEYRNRLEPHMNQLEQKGVWHKVARTVVPGYYCGKEGVVFSYRVV